MLTKIERREERQKLRGESVSSIIEMNVKVTGVDKLEGKLFPFYFAQNHTAITSSNNSP